jgi:hypothetical protein
MFRDAERIARCERFEPGKGMTPDFKTRSCAFPSSLSRA